jgi:hypothetical protein
MNNGSDVSLLDPISSAELIIYDRWNRLLDRFRRHRDFLILITNTRSLTGRMRTHMHSKRRAQTPHMDFMVSEGIELTAFYSFKCVVESQSQWPLH